MLPINLNLNSSSPCWPSNSKTLLPDNKCCLFPSCFKHHHLPFKSQIGSIPATSPLPPTAPPHLYPVPIVFTPPPPPIHPAVITTRVAATAPSIKQSTVTLAAFVSHVSVCLLSLPIPDPAVTLEPLHPSNVFVSAGGWRRASASTSN